MIAMSINAETKSVETAFLLRSTLLVIALFFCMSAFYTPVPALVASIAGVVAAYFLTAPIQPHLGEFTPFQVQWGVVAPIFLFSLGWVFFLLTIDNRVAINTSLPVFISVVFAAFGPVYFKIGSKPLKPLKVPYIVRYALFTGFASLLIIGLNYDKTLP